MAVGSGDWQTQKNFGVVFGAVMEMDRMSERSEKYRDQVRMEDDLSEEPQRERQRQAEKTEQVCRGVLEREERMLVLFSGDARLTYVPDREGEHFELLPKEQKVTVPLLFFQQIGNRAGGISESRLLWHLYETLALYPDWQRHPDLYLAREETFRPEAEEMTAYFLEKVKNCHLEDDPAFQPSLLFFSAQNEILDFLEDMDRYAAVLTVEALAPIYRDSKVKQDIADMFLWEDMILPDADSGQVRKSLAGSFLAAEFFGLEVLSGQESGAVQAKTFSGLPDGSIQNELVSTDVDGAAQNEAASAEGAYAGDHAEADSMSQIAAILRQQVCGKSRFAFIRDSFREMIVQHQGIEARDPLLRTFLLPEYLRLWKQDIDHMTLSHTIEEETDVQKKAACARRSRKSPDMDRSEKEKMLWELDDEQKKARRAVISQLSGQTDLSSFGVTEEDLKLFRHYEAKVRPQREQMKQFWRRLVGEASRETGVKIEGTPKGKLDVPVLIDSWPSFVEAQQKQNYRGLNIFDSWELQKKTKELPRVLDISFVIDNSGSMRSGKLQAAREALAIVLLSLQDFQSYLQANAALTHQKIDVRTETWLFGTGCRRVLTFDDRARKREADMVLSVSRLRGDDGSTDDGQCLREILKEITPAEVRQLESGKRVRMFFELTDGASSFPGGTKAAVEELQKKHVEIQAIEIGSDGDKEARRIFDYVFGDRGTFLGSETKNLTAALTGAVKRQMKSVFVPVQNPHS